eukprot:CAMPEP_0173198288 /NCGR_PEP_ID=MMETSP1141-20130122/16608_1 /TAXON_ID=483371 /ORGANISM="non described non described, Strain CCMP2298" /LENGTH=109 /DNA_ID=CAMNT_0014123073 /DNA_START=393 /DNA_END=722 /DNA_ORIENTATION=-
MELGQFQKAAQKLRRLLDGATVWAVLHLAYQMNQLQSHGGQDGGGVAVAHSADNGRRLCLYGELFVSQQQQQRVHVMGSAQVAIKAREALQRPKHLKAHCGGGVTNGHF